MLTKLFFLFAFALAALGTPTIPPPPEPALGGPQPMPIFMTNAQRLARGLHPNPPVRRDPAQRPRPSSRPRNLSRGFIAISDGNTGDRTAYLANSFNQGFYDSSSNLDDALRVQFDQNTASAGFADLVTSNGPDPHYSFLGAITKSALAKPVIVPGSILVLGGVQQSSRQLRPAEEANSVGSNSNREYVSESAIWTLHPDSTLTVRWVNLDHTVTELFSGYWRDSVILSSNKTETEKTYNTPSESVRWVVLTFVPLLA